MIDALLYQVQVNILGRTKAKITLVPTWLGRLLKRRMRAGVVYRAQSDEGTVGWWWSTTDRYVGTYIERYIEAAPVLRIEDLTVEQLLLEDPTPVGKRRKRP